MDKLLELDLLRNFVHLVTTCPLIQFPASLPTVSDHLASLALDSALYISITSAITQCNVDILNFIVNYLTIFMSQCQTVECFKPEDIFHSCVMYKLIELWSELLIFLKGKLYDFYIYSYWFIFIVVNIVWCRLLVFFFLL